MAFLAVVATLPFSTSLLAGFITLRTALIVYWANILALGLALIWAWRYAACAGLVSPAAPTNINNAIQERVIAAQALYAVGAALCLIGTYWSIGFIVAVQLYYAIAPGMIWKGWARRLGAGGGR